MRTFTGHGGGLYVLGEPVEGWSTRPRTLLAGIGGWRVTIDDRVLVEKTMCGDEVRVNPGETSILFERLDTRTMRPELGDDLMVALTAFGGEMTAVTKATAHTLLAYSDEPMRLDDLKEVTLQ